MDYIESSEADQVVHKALKAKRESKSLEFKESFDVTANRDWCEILKDIVAIANSGGGALLIGVDNKGNPTGDEITPILELDPAAVSDKVHQYTGIHFSDCQIFEVNKDSRKIAMFKIGSHPVPIVFTRPGTYSISDKKQRTAFSAGTVYFRHGAKSEPGNTDDLRQSIERRLEEVRKNWISGVRKVVHAPPGSRVAILSSEIRDSDSPHAVGIRIVDDPSAPAYRIVDPDKTHPYRQKELITEVNNKIPDSFINQYDVQAIRHVYNIDENNSFVYKPKFGTRQYSKDFVHWIVEQYRKNNNFFHNTREQFSKR